MLASLYSIFIALIISAIASILIYIKQKIKHETRSRINFLLLYKQLKNSEEPSDLSPELETKTQRELNIEFKKLQKKITKAIVSNNLERAIILMDEYSNIVNIIADNKIDYMEIAPFKIKKLTLTKLFKLHRSLFPKNYEFAGKIRRVRVCIEGEKQKNPRFLPPPGDKVLNLLKNMLVWWHYKSKQIKNSPREEKIDAMSKFHHNFLKIHPFLDGNGRIAKLLLKLQLKELFGKNIKIRFPEKKYYQALSHADKKDRSKLNSLITKLIEEKIGHSTQLTNPS